MTNAIYFPLEPALQSGARVCVQDGHRFIRILGFEKRDWGDGQTAVVVGFKAVLREIEQWLADRAIPCRNDGD